MADVARPLVGPQQYQALEPQPSRPLKTWCTGTACCGTVALIAASFPFLFWCHSVKDPMVPKEANTLSLINDYLNGSKTLNFWDLPEEVPAAQIMECNYELKKPVDFVGLRWGESPAKEAPGLMYKGTKVPGLFEQVPQALRGVFWMKGNGLPEELISLQNGQWFPEDRVYVVPQSPFMLGWAAGKPNEAPFGGAAYIDQMHKLLASALPGLMVGLSFKFDECPGRPFNQPGHVCRAGTGGYDPANDFDETTGTSTGQNLTYATMQLHMFGNMSYHITPSSFTLELDDSGVQPGSKWHRGVYLSNLIMGRCECEFGASYEMVKILDENGDPIEPYFSEWTAYMGEVPVALWGQITDGELRKLLVANDFWAAGARIKEMFCATIPIDPFKWCKTDKLEPPVENMREFVRY